MCFAQGAAGTEKSVDTSESGDTKGGSKQSRRRVQYDPSLVQITATKAEVVDFFYLSLLVFLFFLLQAVLEVFLIWVCS